MIDEIVASYFFVNELISCASTFQPTLTDSGCTHPVPCWSALNSPQYQRFFIYPLG